MHLAQPAFGVSFKKIAKRGLKVAMLPTYVSYRLSKAAFDLAVKPVRSRIHTVVAGRAKKLAWDRRQSTLPTVEETREARAWAKRQFRAKGPHGYMLATLAGGGDDLLGQLGVAPAVIAAAVPVLTALAAKMAKDMAKSGAIALTEKAQASLTPKLQPAEQQAVDAVQAIEETADQTEQTLEGVLLPPKPTSNLGLGLGLGIGLVATGLGVFVATR